MFTIGHRLYLALEGGPPSFPQNFPDSVVLRIPRHIVSFPRTGLSPPLVGLSRPFRFSFNADAGSYNPHSRSRGFGLFRFRSPLLTESLTISLPSGTKMFQFPECASRLRGMIRYCLTGFPHSDICGSTPLCDSPQLFAAFRVLLRQSVPRHPPLALFPLTSSFPHLGTIIISSMLLYRCIGKWMWR